MIKPTIGRRVWYWPTINDQAEMFLFDNTQPLDAGIAYVHSDNLINISVADQAGNITGKSMVKLIQEGDKRPEYGGFCEWMTYQKEQSNKLSSEVKND